MCCAGFEERERSGQEGRGVGRRPLTFGQNLEAGSRACQVRLVSDESAQGCVDLGQRAERQWTEGSRGEASAFDVRVWAGAPLHERPHPMLRLVREDERGAAHDRPPATGRAARRPACQSITVP
jgi:hypothetical protein